MKTVFLRVLNAEDKAAALLEAVRDPVGAQGWRRFEMRHESFSRIPRSPFAYWATPSMLRCFDLFQPFEAAGRIARISNPVADNFRYVRTSWEPAVARRTANAASDVSWVPLCKGGAFSPYYYDPHLLVAWSLERRTFLGFVGTEHRPLEKPASLEHFFKPGLTWPVRTSGLSFRVMPAGCVFSSKGPAAFDSAGLGSTLSLVGLLNSRAFAALVSLQLARTELAQSYEVGLIQSTPVPALSEIDRDVLASVARRAWSLIRLLDTRTETSHAFTVPALLQAGGLDLASSAAAWAIHVHKLKTELASIQVDLDERCFALYGIDPADCQTATEGSLAGTGVAGTTAESDAVQGEAALIEVNLNAFELCL